MSFKNASVVMLSTNQKANLKLGQNGLLVNNTLGYDAHFTNQHLYFLSDEEIKEGDWYVNFKVNEKNWDEIIPDRVCKADLNETNEFKVHPYSKYCKKIIATTDKLRVMTKDEFSGVDNQHLPQPSKSFIEKYVKEHYSGVPIEKVLIEYNHIVSTNGVETDTKEWLKVASDNTITIKKVKDTYTQQEVDDLLDRNTAETTAQILKKFEGFKSREEVVSLIMQSNLESHLTKEGGFDIIHWIEKNVK